MIDTDKYEGHTEGPWDYDSEGQRVDINADDDLTYEVICSKVLTDADGSLIADAPLLLEEDKRLREAIADIADNMHAADASYMCGFIDDLWKVIE